MTKDLCELNNEFNSGPKNTRTILDFRPHTIIFFLTQGQEHLMQFA